MLKKELAIGGRSNRSCHRVEGYAVEPKKEKMPDAFAFHGLAAAYRQAGFKEVRRRSETRPIMRYYIR